MDRRAPAQGRALGPRGPGVRPGRHPLLHRHPVRTHLSHRCVGPLRGRRELRRRAQRHEDPSRWPAFIADHRLGLLAFHLDSGTITPALDRAWAKASAGSTTSCSPPTGISTHRPGQSGLQDLRGRVLRLRANGVLECVLDRIPSPNGLALNADESASSRRDPRQRRVAHSVGPPRSACKVGVFLHLSGGGGPDGLAIDEEGNLAVAMPGTGSCGSSLRAASRCTGSFRAAGMRPTNLAFGGSDRRRASSLSRAAGPFSRPRCPTPGLRLFSHRKLHVAPAYSEPPNSHSSTTSTQGHPR